ncbi:MAG TPA: phytanoyl-CoA dioxygenase family protein [Oceanipulchritudo sp.]|nr:phytanoyl-CoA dioxygenase family protein [Oceanipulchritudo sp.]
MKEQPLMSPHRAKFEEEGFCHLDGLFTESELKEIEAFFEEYKHNGGAVFDAGSTYEEIDPGKRQVRAMHPHRYSERAKGWFLNPAVMDVLAELLGKEAFGAQTMYYYKPPGAKGQGMHQDNFYLLSKPANCIAAWTPIDDSTEVNGCLWVVPGSHRHDIHCPETNKNGSWNSYGDSHINPFPRDARPVPVPVKRGQTLFFGGNLIHGSGPNRTRDRCRRTFISHYVDETTESLAQFYHPVLDRHGNTVSRVEVHAGGGPCGDGWMGATH